MALYYFAVEFQIQIGPVFEPLIGLETNNIYSQFKNVNNKVTETIVGYKKQVRGYHRKIKRFMHNGAWLHEIC